MKGLVTSAVLFAGVGVATSAPLPPLAGTSTTDVIEALSGVDFLPGATELSALSDLATLGDIANGTGDPGVRLRAYRSLGQFDEPQARGALGVGIDRYRDATSGIELLYLIAAAEGLGSIATPDDVPTLAPLLDAPSRDLRVVVARALGHVADPTACNLLRRRRNVEQVETVQIAIDDSAAVCP
jgi:HEAT repeat protein